MNRLREQDVDGGLRIGDILRKRKQFRRSFVFQGFVRRVLLDLVKIDLPPVLSRGQSGLQAVDFQLVVLVKFCEVKGSLLQQIFDRLISLASQLLVLTVSGNGPKNTEGEARGEFVEFSQIAHQSDGGTFFHRIIAHR